MTNTLKGQKMLGKKIYTLHDMKAETYLPPMVLKNKGEAIRQMETALKNPNTIMHQAPQDFTLMEIGDWNEDTGEISPHDKPILVSNLSELVQ